MMNKMMTDNRDRKRSASQVMTAREWAVTLMLMMVPVLNIVLLVRWATADKELTPACKVNWARGALVTVAILATASSVLAGLYCLIMYIHY